LCAAPLIAAAGFAVILSTADSHLLATATSTAGGVVGAAATEDAAGDRDRGHRRRARCGAAMETPAVAGAAGLTMG